MGERSSRCGDVADRPRRRWHPLHRRGTGRPALRRLPRLAAQLPDAGRSSRYRSANVAGVGGHSTPTLTARYSHRRLHDLVGAVEKRPSILPTEAPVAVLQATGTAGDYTPLTQLLDSRGGGLRIADVPCSTEGENRTGRNTLNLQRVEAGCESLIAVESRAGDGIRSHDVQLGKRVITSVQKPTEVLQIKNLQRFFSVCKVLRGMRDLASKPDNSVRAPVVTR